MPEFHKHHDDLTKIYNRGLRAGYANKSRKKDLNALRNIIEGEGYDSIQYRNDAETPIGALDDQSYIPLRRNQIRSVNAEFNPKKMHSGDLMAGVTGLGVLGAGMGASEDADALYLGARAPGANKAMLALAEKLEKQGFSKSTIWRQTGWGRGFGRDREWRYRVDDSNIGNKWDPDKGEYKVTHPELEKHDPDLLNEITVVNDRHSPGDSGLYDPNEKKIHLGGYAWRHEKKPEVLLHELQHALQHKYGFAQGADPGELKSAFSNFMYGLQRKLRDKGLAIARSDPRIAERLDAHPNLEDTYAERAIQNNPRLKRTADDIDEWNDVNRQVDAGKQKYARNAGEIEANIVEADYKASLAGKTPDVPGHVVDGKPTIDGKEFSPIVRTTEENNYPAYRHKARRAHQPIPGSEAALAAFAPTRRDYMHSPADNMRAMLYGGRPDEGLAGDEFPNLHRIGGILMDFKTPYEGITGPILGGAGKYLMDFGSQQSQAQKIANAAGAAVDIVPLKPLKAIMLGLTAALADQQEGVQYRQNPGT